MCLAGQGLFEANAIQFGMDQLLEASSDQLGYLHPLVLLESQPWDGYFNVLCMLLRVTMYYRECQNQFDISKS